MWKNHKVSKVFLGNRENVHCIVVFTIVLVVTPFYNVFSQYAAKNHSDINHPESIVIANGTALPDFVGSENLDLLLTPIRPIVQWIRPNPNIDESIGFQETTNWPQPTTINDITIGNNTISFDASTKQELPLETQVNTFWIYTTATIRKAFADTNNDGQKDIIYSGTSLPDATSLPTGAVFFEETPKWISNTNWSTIVPPKFDAYQVINDNGTKKRVTYNYRPWFGTTYPLDVENGYYPDWADYNGSLNITEINIWKNNIKGYPNPAKDIVSFEIAGQYSVGFYNMAGQLVTVQKSQDNQSVDISKLPVGTYIAKIIQQSGEEHFVTIIKK